jgi:hypothetical protein
MTILSFSVFREVSTNITRATQRYLIYLGRAGLPVPDMFGLPMDLTACEENGCPIDGVSLLEADDFTFVHDAGGIHRHIDRTTGKLGNCLRPRVAQMSPGASI